MSVLSHYVTDTRIMQMTTQLHVVSKVYECTEVYALQRGRIILLVPLI